MLLVHRKLKVLEQVSLHFLINVVIFKRVFNNLVHMYLLYVCIYVCIFAYQLVCFCVL